MEEEGGGAARRLPRRPRFLQPVVAGRESDEDGDRGRIGDGDEDGMLRPATPGRPQSMKEGEKAVAEGDLFSSLSDCGCVNWIVRQCNTEHRAPVVRTGWAYVIDIMRVWCEAYGMGDDVEVGMNFNGGTEDRSRLLRCGEFGTEVVEVAEL